MDQATKLDILVLAAHPDDAELTCSGTIAAMVAKGKKVGIIDFTRGEMGTRGTPELRLEEAEKAAQIMQLTVRENLGFADAFFQNDREHQMEVIKMIRKYRPEIVLANAVHDRHPDHAKAAELSRDACFYSGLKKISTRADGHIQMAWRPAHVYHFIQSTYIQPDFVFDISPYWEVKVAAIQAYKSQFYLPDQNAEEDQTFISTPDFMQFVESRAREFGKIAGATYAEGYTTNRLLMVDDLFDLK